MIRPELGVYLAVISAGRPGNVAASTALAGPATWYVGHGQLGAYAAQGAPALVEGGGLCASRNAALADAWARGLPCLQLSDDLRGLRSMPGRQRIPFGQVVAALHDALLAAGPPGRPARLAGVAPTDNALNYAPSRRLATAAYILGDLVLVAPCDQWWDTNLRLKEDYDYTLQHLAAHGCVARCNWLLATFDHRTNAGGAVAYRTPAAERAAIAYLRAKWPGQLAPNPRRPGEVLLRWRPDRLPQPLGDILGARATLRAVARNIPEGSPAPDVAPVGAGP